MRSVESECKKKIEGLLKGPKEPDQEFVKGGHTYGEVYRLASSIIEEFPDTKERPGRLCLCTEDWGLVAAAILASLSGGPELVLPYSFSRQALEEVCDVMGITAALSDGTIDLPQGIDGYNPIMSDRRGLQGVQPIDIHKGFLKLFTGGSTGAPRVWTKSPLNIIGEAGYQADRLGFARDDLFASTVPPYHIYGLLYSVLAPFLSSSTVLGGISTFPREIAAALNTGQATVLVSVPMHYRVIRGMGIKAPSLRMALSSAGPLDREDGKDFFNATGIGVEEIYGSTETGGIASRNPDGGREFLEPFGPVGWKIKDERLCVRSPFVSTELPIDDEGYFVTGDRARHESGRGLVLMGRADGVVKVGGKRVDLDDVRERLLGMPGVSEAYVLSLQGRKGREREIAALIEGDITEAGLRDLMKAAMEPYAMPRRIKIVKKIPLLSTGKYDREAIERIVLNNNNRSQGD